MSRCRRYSMELGHRRSRGHVQAFRRSCAFPTTLFDSTLGPCSFRVGLCLGKRCTFAGRDCCKIPCVQLLEVSRPFARPRLPKEESKHSNSFLLLPATTSFALIIKLTSKFPIFPSSTARFSNQGSASARQDGFFFQLLLLLLLLQQVLLRLLLLHVRCSRRRYDLGAIEAPPQHSAVPCKSAPAVPAPDPVPIPVANFFARLLLLVPERPETSQTSTARTCSRSREAADAARRAASGSTALASFEVWSRSSLRPLDSARSGRATSALGNGRAWMRRTTWSSTERPMSTHK